MTLPSWAFEYPVMEERKYPDRYSGDYLRDSLPDDLWRLEAAVTSGDTAAARELLEQGADRDAPLDSNHMTALMIACTTGKWDLIKMLVEEFDADFDGPLSRAGLRAIDYAGIMGFRSPNIHPITDYLKSRGSSHTWWGAVCAGDFARVREYVEHGQDVNEVNPIMWNGNAVHLAEEFGQGKIGRWLVIQGAVAVVRNCANIDTHAMKWSVGRGDSFYYRTQHIEKPGVGVKGFYFPTTEAPASTLVREQDRRRVEVY